MAIGDRAFLYNNPEVELKVGNVTTDISKAVTQAMPTIQHQEVNIGHTPNRNAPLIEVSDKFTGSVALTFFTGGFAAADLDGVFATAVKPPYGSGDGTATLIITPTQADAAAGNPELTLPIVISQWEPFGAGQIGQAVTQTRTFNISGRDEDASVDRGAG